MANDSFVCYCPKVERTDPTFDSALQTALDDVKRYISHPLPTAGGVRAVRDAHAKGYGLARAELEILDGLPAEYAQGLGYVCGVGVKFFDIDGQSITPLSTS